MLEVAPAPGGGIGFVSTTPGRGGTGAVREVRAELRRMAARAGSGKGAGAGSGIGGVSASAASKTMVASKRADTGPLAAKPKKKAESAKGNAAGTPQGKAQATFDFKEK